MPSLERTSINTTSPLLSTTPTLTRRTWKSSNIAACFNRIRMDIVAPFIPDTTGCASALASAPMSPRPAGCLPVPLFVGLGTGDVQASSNSFPPALAGDGVWSGFCDDSAGAPVSWQQYSPRNQKAERLSLPFGFRQSAMRLTVAPSGKDGDGTKNLMPRSSCAPKDAVQQVRPRKKHFPHGTNVHDDHTQLRQHYHMA